MDEMLDLDPADWSGLRALGHRMLDDMFDHLVTLRDQPVWRPMPAVALQALRRPLPRGPRRSMTTFSGWCFRTGPETCTHVSWDGSMAAATRSECWQTSWPAG